MTTRGRGKYGKKLSVNSQVSTSGLVVRELLRDHQSARQPPEGEIAHAHARIQRCIYDVAQSDGSTRFNVLMTAALTDVLLGVLSLQVRSRLGVTTFK